MTAATPLEPNVSAGPVAPAAPVPAPPRSRREAWMWAAIVLALPPWWYAKGPVSARG